jgi:hypothetical protein
MANAQAALAQAQTNRENAVGPAGQLAQEAQAALAKAQANSATAVRPSEQLAQQAQAALAEAQARREAALTALSTKLGSLIERLRQQLGRPASPATPIQRAAAYQLALQLVQLIDQIGPAPRRLAAARTVPRSHAPPQGSGAREISAARALRSLAHLAYRDQPIWLKLETAGSPTVRVEP